MIITELRETLVEQCQENITDSESEASDIQPMEAPLGISKGHEEESNPHELQNKLIDCALRMFDEEEDKNPAELLNWSWISEPEDWESTKW